MMGISVQPTCLDQYFGSFEQSLAPHNYQRRALSNYRTLLRRFGRVVEAEGVTPSALTLELANELVQRMPFNRKNTVRMPNLVRRFVYHLIEIGVATAPPVTAAQIERIELLRDFESFMLGQRGLSLSSVYHAKRYTIRFLDHHFGNGTLDLAAISPDSIISFIEHLQAGRSLTHARTPASHLRRFFQYLFSRAITPTNLALCIPIIYKQYKVHLSRHLQPEDVETILAWVQSRS